MRLSLIPLTLVACTLGVQAQVFLPQSDQDLMVQKGGQLQTTMPSFWNTPVILPQLSSQYPSAGHSWIGYNQSAGVDSTTVVDQYGNYRTFGGMVGFDIEPLSVEYSMIDTIYAHPKMAPYGYLSENIYYAYCPNFSNTTGTYTSMDYMGWDIRNWNVTDSMRVRITNGTSDIPYIGCYDPVTGIDYAITFGKENGVETYYSYIVDPGTHKLKRLAKLGIYDNAENFTSYKAMFSDGVEIYALNRDNVMRIDRKTGLATEVGHFDFEHNSYGIQAIRYDNGRFIFDHYDLYTGTSFWSFSLDNIGADGLIQKELIGYIPTGWDHIFRAPSVELCESEVLSNVKDLKAVASDDQHATITFSVPSTTTSGIALSSTTMANVTVLIDGQAITLPETQYALGSKVSVEVEGLEPTCLHFVSAQCDPVHEWSAVEPFALVGNTLRGVPFCAGADAPGQVSNIRVTALSDVNRIKVSWSAPTSARYAAFGSSFDKNDVTYKVVNSLSGEVVAEGLTETSLLLDIPAHYSTQQFTIIPYSAGMEGTPAESSRYVFGSYVELPYYEDFENSHSLEYFTVINANEDGTARTWNWNTYYHYLTMTTPIGSIYNDDWLITPNFNADSDHVYRLVFTIGNDNKDHNLHITMGNYPSVQSQTQMVADLEGYHIPAKDIELQFYARPETAGSYCFGIYDFSTDNEGMYHIDDLRIEEAFSTHAPDSVTEVLFQPADGGALSGTLFFTLPEKDVLGESLTGLTKYEVYRNDTLVSTITDAQLGSAEAVDVEAIHGYNTYRIVSYNEFGNGWPVDYRVYVGTDIPVEVTGFMAVWAESTQPRRSGVTLSWEAPTKGLRGGYVNPEALTYNIYHFNPDNNQYSLIESGVTGTSFTTSELTGNSQDYYAYAVGAVSSEGEGERVRKGITLGTPYALPFSESWYYGGQNGPWITTSLQGAPGWAIDNNIFNMHIEAVDGDEFQLLLRNLGDDVVSARIASPILDFKNTTNPVLGLWIFHDINVSEGSWFCLEATEDGLNFIDISEHTIFADNAGWVFHVIPLEAVKGKKVQLAIKVYMDEVQSRFFTDALQVVDLNAGNDLAVSSFSYQENQALGTMSNVEVQVVNLGAQEAAEYEVCLFANGEMVGDELIDEPLASGHTRTFTFQIDLQATVQEGVKCYAEVIYDDDNELNNVTDVVTILPLVLDLNAPADLTLNDSQDLSWSAPAEMHGRRVFEDFENGKAFSIDGHNGWICYDGDGQLEAGYTQYYNNYWPNFNNPQAWMIWSLEETGTIANAWYPIDGEKCLISWMVTGQMPDMTNATTTKDDWFISPEVLGGTDLSFQAKAILCSYYGPSSMQILTSATDRDPASFTLLKEYSVGATMVEEVEDISVTLPADARYVAIRCIGTEFALMIDNLEYTLAQTPQFAGYNVYCGFGRQNTSILTDLQYHPQRIGTYAVSAQYDLGESELSNSIEVTTLGIDKVEADEAAQREYWSLDGRRLRDASASGIYIIRQKGAVRKAIVK